MLPPSAAYSTVRALPARAREKVFEAADRLGFVFSDIGRSLQSSTTKTIGCIVPSLMNPVFAEAVQGLQEEIRSAGYQMLLSSSNYDADEEAEVTRLLLAKQVDGIILTVRDVEKSIALDMIEKRDIPVCLMFNRPHGAVPASCIDNHAAARLVADAFFDKGHRHTGFLALRFQSSDRSRERFDGFLDGCRAHGMAEPALLEIDEQGGNLSSLLHDLLSRNTQLTGIFASNDFVALAAIRAAKELGRQVPQDLSIVGFDGIEIGRMVEPSLATIATDAEAMGRLAAQYVLGRLSKNTKSEEDLKLERPTGSPDLGLSFNFRSGDSLDVPAEAKRNDGDVAATTSPSRHPNPSIKDR